MLVERYCRVSDPSNIPLCETCGQVCIANPHPSYNYFSCSLCGSRANITPRVDGPRSLLLLYNYLAAAGIKMSMRTAPAPRTAIASASATPQLPRIRE